MDERRDDERHWLGGHLSLVVEATDWDINGHGRPMEVRREEVSGGEGCASDQRTTERLFRIWGVLGEQANCSVAGRQSPDRP